MYVCVISCIKLNSHLVSFSLAFKMHFCKVFKKIHGHAMPHTHDSIKLVPIFHDALSIIIIKSSTSAYK